MIPARALLRFVLFLLLSGLGAASQTPQEYLNSLLSQKLLLRHFGDTQQARVKSKDLERLPGTCDVAVLVRGAAWEKNKVRLNWEQIGIPSRPGMHRHVCKNTMVYGRGTVEIDGFKADESAGSLAGSLSAILQTPEQYLAAEGVLFDLPPEPDLETTPAADLQFHPAPRALLTVDPNYTTEASRARLNGTVMIALYVGTDGRVHKPSIQHKLGMGLDEKALEVLSLWRFEPARKENQPVVFPMNIQIGFNIY